MRLALLTAAAFTMAAAVPAAAAEAAAQKKGSPKPPPTTRSRSTPAVKRTPAPARTPVARKTAPRKPAAAASMNRKPAGARRTPAAAPRPAARRGGQKPAPRMIGQRQPTPERYKEIQEALARRGYFQDAPDGVWGPASVDALKRFQEEQNIEASGKINSLSLIALGLGPKYENAQAAPAADVSRTETPRAGAPSPPEP